MAASHQAKAFVTSLYRWQGSTVYSCALIVAVVSDSRLVVTSKVRYKTRYVAHGFNALNSVSEGVSSGIVDSVIDGEEQQ